MASPLIAPDWRSLASYDAGRRGHPPHQFKTPSANRLLTIDLQHAFESVEQLGAVRTAATRQVGVRDGWRERLSEVIQRLGEPPLEINSRG